MGYEAYNLDQFLQVIRSTMENHNDLVFIKNLDFQYVYANKQFYEANELEDVIGKTDFELPDYRDPDRYRRVDKSIIRDKIQSRYESKVVHSDGTVSHYLVNKAPILDHKGDVIGIYGSGRSIDDQVEIRGRLEDNLLLIETLLDTIPYPVFIKNIEGIYIRVNKAYESEILIKSEDIIGKTDYDIHSPEEADFFVEKDERVMKTGTRDSYIAQGTETGRKYLITKDVLRDASGRIIGIVGIVNLYLDLNEIRQDLINNQRIESIANLAGGVAHDLNNILTNVTGISSLMLLDEIDPKKRDELTTIYSASKRAADLIAKLQTFAQNRPIEMVEHDFSKIVQDVMTLISSNYGSSITIEESYDEDPLPVFGDTTQLSQMVMNLVINAVDAIIECDDGRIEVSTERGIIDKSSSHFVIRNELGTSKECVIFTVKDNGDGINPFILNRIFDPYFTTKERAGGTGLGLSIVYGVVSNHMGSLQLFSNSEKGTEFTISLPLHNS